MNYPKNRRVISVCLWLGASSTRNLRSALPIPEGLGGGEAERDRRKPLINLGLLLKILPENRYGGSATRNNAGGTTPKNRLISVDLKVFTKLFAE